MPGAWPGPARRSANLTDPEMAAEPTMPLDRAFEKRLAGVINARAGGVLQGGLKGVERESLRVTPTNSLDIWV